MVLRTAIPAGGGEPQTHWGTSVLKSFALMLNTVALLVVFFSEKFMVRLNKNGGPKNPEKVDRLCALFTVTNTD